MKRQVSCAKQESPLYESVAESHRLLAWATLVESVMFAVFAYLPEVWMTEDFLWCNSVRIVEIHRTVNIKPYDGVNHPAIHQRTANACTLFFSCCSSTTFYEF